MHNSGSVPKPKRGGIPFAPRVAAALQLERNDFIWSRSLSTGLPNAPGTHCDSGERRSGLMVFIMVRRLSWSLVGLRRARRICVLARGVQDMCMLEWDLNLRCWPAGNSCEVVS